MNIKEQFISDVISRYSVKNSSTNKKIDPATIAIIMAILQVALKILMDSKCLANIFPTYFVNKTLKQASRTVEKDYGTNQDFYKEYCNDSLTESILEVKKSLTNQETKDLLNELGG